ncbi:MAG: hypothetical protein PHO53_04330 [Actinomycetota bacterium]|nr:hypothetical protein [Actinomycetota bacterium]
MIRAAYFLVSSLISILILLLSRDLAQNDLLVRTNYAGRRIPTSAGLVFLPVSVLCFTADAFRGGIGKSVNPDVYSFTILVCVMCFLGFLDDMVGSRASRGFKGHLTSFFKGKATSGFAKASIGFFVSMAISIHFSENVGEVFLNAFVIALAANLFNLLDVMPGRALKIFLPSLAGVIALNWKLGDFLVPQMLAIGGVALVLFVGDIKEWFMIGDSGSNVLGAVVGLGIVIGANFWWKLALMLVFLLLNLLSEKFSFSRIISRNRVLNWLDNLGRKGNIEILGK